MEEGEQEVAGEGSELLLEAWRRIQTGGEDLHHVKVWPGGQSGLPLFENQPVELALLPSSKSVSSRLLWAREPRDVFFILLWP